MVNETPGKRDGAAAHLQAGERGEDRALQHLLGQGLVLITRNYRVARGPSARGGEIDLIMREADGTLVFVEVRSRGSADHGGAAASVGGAKRRSLVRAAEHFLLTWPRLPPCRFDVVAIEGSELVWLRGAFDASR
jgi:putative endonuclease